MTDPTGAQIVWDCLTREGVTDVFGYPGGAILPIYDAMAAYPVRHVLVRHEQGATHMADGYARASGRVGVALATSGPGATNMVTGLATAKMDSSPVVCITGQVSSHLLGTTAFQEVDITRIAAPVTKESHLVTRPEDIGPTLQRAFAVAREGRPGPVLVDITKDAQQGRCAPQPGAPETPASARGERRGLTQQDRRALELIVRARRPVILAGHGILLGGAERELRQFAEAHDIPVALTLLGLGALPASHPLNLGMMGLHGGVWVNEAIQAADLLIALGMRFDDRVTGDPARYAPTARKIHVDIDPGELNKIIPVDLGIAADAGRVLRRWLRVDIRRRPSGWSRQIADRRACVQQGDRAVAPLEPLTAIHVIQALSRMTGGQALVATDVGQHQMWEAQHYGHETPRSLITSGGCGTMGFALPAAIGAKLAMPTREVWVVVGDGGFQMAMPELATVVQERLAIKIAIINNGCLGLVRQLQHHFYERRYEAVALSGPDFIGIGNAFGIRTCRVDRPDGVASALADARAHEGPVLIDFQVPEGDLVYPHVRAGAALDDMFLRPGAMRRTDTARAPLAMAGA